MNTPITLWALGGTAYTVTCAYLWRLAGRTPSTIPALPCAQETTMPSTHHLLTDATLPTGTRFLADEVTGGACIAADPRHIPLTTLTDLRLSKLLTPGHGLTLHTVTPCNPGWTVTGTTPAIDPVFGPQADALRAMVSTAERVFNTSERSPEDARFAAALDADYPAIETACDQAMDALHAAGADAHTWRSLPGCVYGNLVLALAARDLIGITPGWTPDAYATLARPWIAAFGTPLHPDDAQPLVITTFGYLHDVPPAAHLTVDLRIHFRDPHVNPALRELTALDAPVRDAVMTTPGIRGLVDATADAVRAFLQGPSAGPVSVAVGCAGGRHRAATVGMELAQLLADQDVTLVHRDLDKAVVNR